MNICWQVSALGSPCHLQGKRQWGCIPCRFCLPNPASLVTCQLAGTDIRKHGNSRASFHHTLPQKYIEMALSAYLLLLTKHLNMGSPEMFERDWPKMTPKFPMDYQWIMMINPCQSSVPMLHWPCQGALFPQQTKAQTDWATGVSELCELPSCADLLPELSATTPISWNWGSWEFATHFGVPPANHWSREGASLNPILHRFLMVYRYFERSIPHPWNQSSGWIIMNH